MLIGRFRMIVPILALAGSLARKKIVPASAGTFPVTGFTFVVLLIGTVMLVGALTFFPALALGPGCRTFPDAEGQTVLTIEFYDARNLFPFLIRKFVGPRIVDTFSKLEPAADGEEPGHVRHDGRRGDHHRGNFPLARTRTSFVVQIALWLWFTVLFANFAEAMAEGRGKAQAKALRRTRTQTDRQ